MTHRRQSKFTRAAFALTMSAVALAAVGCEDVNLGPGVAASIEMTPYPWPSVVIGDTLRDSTGKAAPIRAIVRDSRGGPIDATGLRYLYADYNRDSAMSVDSLTGIVVARKAVTADVRLAARVGASLQVIQKILVTNPPDTVIGSTTSSVLTTVFPDTGRSIANENSTSSLGVTVKGHTVGDTTTATVNGWIVQFSLVKPANPTNDTTQAAYLVNDNGTASVIDTTDGSGAAGRKVRVRAARFPTSGTDTLVVQVRVLYRGKPIGGSGLLLKAAVTRGTG